MWRLKALGNWIYELVMGDQTFSQVQLVKKSDGRLDWKLLKGRAFLNYANPDRIIRYLETHGYA